MSKLCPHGLSFLILAAVALGGPLDAQGRSWSAASRILGATAGLAILSDWTTTVDMARRAEWAWGPEVHRGRHEECGLGRLLIGRRPKLATVNRVFIANTVLIAVVADRILANKRSPILRIRWRDLLLSSVAVVEGYSGASNHLDTGLRFNFHF